MSSESKTELKVYFCQRETECAECGETINKGDLNLFVPGSQHLCLSCGDLDHLIYLPSGNTALTRRSAKYSTLVAVVYRFSSTRNRNERQGILIEKEALEAAEAECLSDEELREKRRERDAERRERADRTFLDSFAQQIRERYPYCPEGREYEIALHACEKYSGRVGRTDSAKKFEANAVDLAVIAHIRHRETEYDSLLMQGYDRSDARKMIEAEIDSVKSNWTLKK